MNTLQEKDIMKVTTFLAVFGILLMNAGFTTSPSSPASIAGHIVDLYGSPLSDAVIELSRNQIKNLSVRSDKDGGYLINNLTEGRVTVTALARGFRPEDSVFDAQGRRNGAVRCWTRTDEHC